MAKEIQTLVWCDLCLGEDEAREEATHMNNTITLGVGARARPLTLDLCERHFKELLEPLTEALAAYGAPVGDAPPVPRKGSSKKKVGPFRCEVEGCQTRPLNTIDSFSKHVRTMHGFGIKEYRREFGEPKLADAAPAVAVPAPREPDLFQAEAVDAGPGPIGISEVTCEECGKKYSHELGNNRPTQALGVHLAKVHGIMAKDRKAS